MSAYETVDLQRRDVRLGGEATDHAVDLDRIGVRMAFSDLQRDIEPAWRALEAHGIDSPGQSFDFIRIWTETFEIPRQNQVYVAVEISGRPLMVIALERRRWFGLTALVPFAGTHVGVNGPLIDRDRMMLLSDADRKLIWKRIRKSLDADILHFGRVLTEDARLLPGSSRIASDCLFRTEFSSWEDCDQEQRSRSRRKHDRQQGQKLAALGVVAYAEFGAADDATAAIDTLFDDRAARFAEQGIGDPFAAPKVRAFYRSVFRSEGALTGRMQVLKLDESIVAARYNLVAGSRMFCLISSMSASPALQPGSPGKQILVHLMQRIFTQGIRSFDMGAGYTDEKRHWCNVHHHLVEVLMPVTMRGALLTALIVIGPSLKHAIKARPRLFVLAKAIRARLPRRGGSR